jgi:hypothetical protein
MREDLPKVPELTPPVLDTQENIKQNNTRKARPWDLFNKNIGRVEEKIKNERMDICKVCPFFIKPTGQCSRCGCIMEAKTRLPNASCPEGKWHTVEINPNSLSYKD